MEWDEWVLFVTMILLIKMRARQQYSVHRWTSRLQRQMLEMTLVSMIPPAAGSPCSPSAQMIQKCLTRGACRGSSIALTGLARLANRRITDSDPEELKSALLLCEESLEPLLQTAVFAQLNAPPPADVQAALPDDIEATSARADVEATSPQADEHLILLTSRLLCLATLRLLCLATLRLLCLATLRLLCLVTERLHLCRLTSICSAW
ncbi:hypothetical protein FHG87_007399 [Trinorchestia longiramus]|nr:hypothetical protein FHG87_007399 [Trinorchestia longiramus]